MAASAIPTPTPAPMSLSTSPIASTSTPNVNNTVTNPQTYGNQAGEMQAGATGAGDETKLFIGQVPHSATEQVLRDALAPFTNGINELVILKRDGVPRGCAFLKVPTRADAERVIREADGRVMLPGARRELIIKYAGTKDLEQREKSTVPGATGGPGWVPMSSPPSTANDFKIYVSGLSPNTDEHGVRTMFAPFGLVTEAILLRERSGQSKGVGFVKFRHWQDAQNAIDATNMKVKDAGQTLFLQCRWADRDGRRGAAPQIITPNFGYGGIPPSYGIPGAAVTANDPYFAAYQQSLQSSYASYYNQYPQSTPTTASGVPPASAYSSYPYAAYGAAALYGTAAATDPYAAAATVASYYQQPYYQPQVTGADVLSASATYGNYAAAAAVPGAPGAAAPSAGSFPTAPLVPAGLERVLGKDVKGPDGSNVFVYNVPDSMDDIQLYNMFAPYGTILSAKVQKEVSTGRNKGFAFVSYDSAAAAQASINALNNLMVAGKKLTVRLKSADAPSRTRPY